MRRVAFGALLAAFAALPAFAQMEMIDTDSDGMASFDELSVIYEDFTDEQFAALDTDGDGLLSEEEMNAGLESGDLAPLEE